MVSEQQQSGSSHVLELIVLDARIAQVVIDVRLSDTSPPQVVAEMRRPALRRTGPLGDTQRLRAVRLVFGGWHVESADGNTPQETGGYSEGFIRHLNTESGGVSRHRHTGPRVSHSQRTSKDVSSKRDGARGPRRDPHKTDWDRRIRTNDVDEKELVHEFRLITSDTTLDVLPPLGTGIDVITTDSQAWTNLVILPPLCAVLTLPASLLGDGNRHGHGDSDTTKDGASIPPRSGAREGSNGDCSVPEVDHTNVKSLERKSELPTRLHVSLPMISLLVSAQALELVGQAVAALALWGTTIGSRLEAAAARDLETRRNYPLPAPAATMLEESADHAQNGDGNGGEGDDGGVDDDREPGIGAMLVCKTDIHEVVLAAAQRAYGREVTSLQELAFPTLAASLASRQGNGREQQQACGGDVLDTESYLLPSTDTADPDALIMLWVYIVSETTERFGEGTANKLSPLLGWLAEKTARSPTSTITLARICSWLEAALCGRNGSGQGQKQSGVKVVGVDHKHNISADVMAELLDTEEVVGLSAAAAAVSASVPWEWIMNLHLQGIKVELLDEVSLLVGSVHAHVKQHGDDDMSAELGISSLSVQRVSPTLYFSGQRVPPRELISFQHDVESVPFLRITASSGRDNNR
jgi:hypothetical protein